MSKEDLSNINVGNSRKYAFEGGEKDEASIFLETLNLRSTVRLHSAHPKGYSKWDGGGFDEVLDVLDKESVMGAKGSGCLEIVDGNGRTTIFMKQGQIIKEHRETMQGVDPRQSKMNI